MYTHMCAYRYEYIHASSSPVWSGVNKMKRCNSTNMILQ